MKKDNYIIPEMDIVYFSNDDVITTSVLGQDEGDYGVNQ